MSRKMVCGKRLKNSEAIGMLLAALAHGDIQPRRLWRRPEFWEWKPRKRRKGQKQRKAMAVSAKPPRLEFFEEADMTMLPERKPAAPLKVTGLPLSDLDRIFEERERVQKLGAALNIAYDRIDAAREELAAIHARIRFRQGLT